jgi:hypothetical protein
MRAHDKLHEANVVGVFDNQEAAEEAVYGLQVAGFRDDHIGFYTRDDAGLVIDYLGHTHTMTGTLLGVLFGAALGACIWSVTGNDWNAWYGPVFTAGPYAGLVSLAVCGAVLGGCTGALLGWGVFTREAVHPGTEVPNGKFVLAVHAADRAADAWAVVHRHGGYEMGQPRATVAAV